MCKPQLMGEEVPSKSRLLVEADVAKVHEGDVMAKHVDNESDEKVPVEEGAELTKMLDQLEVTLASEEDKENEEEFSMANQGCFAHGGEGGIAKSAAVRFSF